MGYTMSEERRRMLEEAVVSAEPYPEELFDIDPKRMLATLAKRELDGMIPIPVQYRVSAEE